MRQRVLLLASQRKASTPGGVSPPHFGRRRETMPFPSSKPITGAFQPLLRLAHLARRDPVLAAPVLPQRHPLGRGPHRAHPLVELILAVAVPERELRHVAPGDRRLLPRDRESGRAPCRGRG